MTLPVPNQQAAIADVKAPDGSSIGKAYLIAPWNAFFQQITQRAPAVIAAAISPFTPNANGTVIITGATTISLKRGVTVINLTGQRIIPVSIGDIISWTGVATVQFLGA